jgi:hypothetical protein
MENLHIAATKSSPEIHFDCEQRILEIKGESYPENTAAFYAPVLSWIEVYLDSLKQQDVRVNMEIIYSNSSSSKVLMDFLELLDEAASKGNSITVNWIYHVENEGALEAGEEFREDLESLTFHFVQKEL